MKAVRHCNAVRMSISVKLFLNNIIMDNNKHNLERADLLALVCDD